MKLRLAVPADAEQINEIYAPYVLETTITFETAVPGSAEFRRRIAAVARDLPWLVLEEEGRLLGYAYASHYHERAAYAWDVECSVYVRRGEHGRGVGTALYRALLHCLAAQGYYTAYALISVPNEASEALHRKFGFVLQGISKNTGYKLRRWCDLACLALPLRSYDEPPAAPPVPFAQCCPERLLSEACPEQSDTKGKRSEEPPC